MTLCWRVTVDMFIVFFTCLHVTLQFSENYVRALLQCFYKYRTFPRLQLILPHFKDSFSKIATPKTFNDGWPVSSIYSGWIEYEGWRGQKSSEVLEQWTMVSCSWDPLYNKGTNMFLISGAAFCFWTLVVNSDAEFWYWILVTNSGAEF